MNEERKPKKKRPTQRSLELLRNDGHLAQVVERWQKIPNFAGGGIRQDLFGCIDVLSIKDGQIWGIQCGAASGHSDHKKKCLAEERLKTWLGAGARFEIHSWSIKGSAGKRKLWECRREELTMDDFGVAVGMITMPPIKGSECTAVDGDDTDTSWTQIMGPGIRESPRSMPQLF